MMDRIALQRNGSIRVVGRLNKSEKQCIKELLDGAGVKYKIKKNIITIKKGDPAEIVLHLGECLEVRTSIPETMSLEGCFAGIH
ncbi:MAG: hypothetical protein AAB491_02435 [Patescibacteria group bacterium]